MYQLVKKVQQGFTLIELMIVVAIIALLVAVALPVYSDFSIRSKVTELILATATYKNDIAEASASRGTLAGSGTGLTVTMSGKITGGSVTDNGVINVQGDGTAQSVGTVVSITLTPTLNAADGKVIWTCSAPLTQYKYVPSGCRN